MLRYVRQEWNCDLGYIHFGCGWTLCQLMNILGWCKSVCVGLLMNEKHVNWAVFVFCKAVRSPLIGSQIHIHISIQIGWPSYIRITLLSALRLYLLMLWSYWSSQIFFAVDIIPIRAGQLWLVQVSSSRTSSAQPSSAQLKEGIGQDLEGTICNKNAPFGSI